MKVDLYIGNQRVDTFSDESVELNSSIANINDITKITTEYTKSFTVPANDNNNGIFKHYYDADIDNSFDARTKVDGRIDINGVPFKYGKWKLEKVIVQKQKPDSYTINFRGNLVSLKDKFKDDEISQLDLTDFNHLYNSDNVLAGLTGSLFSGDLIYNLFTKKRYYYNSNAGDTATENICNTGVLWSDLKPSLRLIKIIEAIETKYDVTFSREFFGRSEFKELFIWLNADTSILGRPTEQLIDWDSGNGGDFGLSNTTDIWTNTQTTAYKYRYRITVEPTDPTIPYKVIVKNFGVKVAEFNCEGGDFTTNFATVLQTNGANTPFEYSFYISASNSIEYEASILLRRTNLVGGGVFDRQSFASTNLLIDTFDVAENLPKIKVIDFMKALFQMFKLIVIADEYDGIYINTLRDYYASGNLHNLTEYVDFSKYEVERGTILNTIKFKFSEPTTILNRQFLLNTGLAYGDEEIILQDEDGALLDGDSLEIELPFEQFIYENLQDQEDNVITNVVLASIFDEAGEPVNPKGHLFYNLLQDITDKPIKFIDDTATEVDLTEINIPLHTFGVVNPQYSTVFSEEFNEYNNVLITNTLYSNYYSEYIDSIFNIKKRNFRYTCKNVPVRILTTIALNDIILIKDRYYRINDYNLNLLTKDLTLNLINSFDNTINAVDLLQNTFFVDGREQSITFFVPNEFVLSGDGTFYTAVNDNGLVTFAIEENTTGDQRESTIDLTANGNITKLTVVQYEND